MIKTYVELGLGIGIGYRGEVLYNPDIDRDIVCVETSAVIPPITISVAVRRGSYLRGYAFSFIQSVIPGLSKEVIRERVEAAANEEEAA